MTGPVDAVNGLGAVWSPDFDAHAEGRLDLSQVRCLMCGQAPCQLDQHPPFASPEYMARLDALHRR